MLTLPFTAADLGLPPYRDHTRRSSVSGVQDKVQLRRRRGGFEMVESGSAHILKTVPRSPHIRLTRDVPANEALTMDIASRISRTRVAEHALVALVDGKLAYLPKRFDRRDGATIPQEDFCQLAGHSPDTHGPDYKYDASYEELAGLVRRFCPAHAVENPKVFSLILFNYAFSNGDAHLKNFRFSGARKALPSSPPPTTFSTRPSTSPPNPPPRPSTSLPTAISPQPTPSLCSSSPCHIIDLTYLWLKRNKSKGTTSVRVLTTSERRKTL